jgi:hypothetical protein
LCAFATKLVEKGRVNDHQELLNENPLWANPSVLILSATCFRPSWPLSKCSVENVEALEGLHI